MKFHLEGGQSPAAVRPARIEIGEDAESAPRFATHTRVEARRLREETALQTRIWTSTLGMTALSCALSASCLIFGAQAFAADAALLAKGGAVLAELESSGADVTALDVQLGRVAVDDASKSARTLLRTEPNRSDTGRSPEVDALAVREVEPAPVDALRNVDLSTLCMSVGSPAGGWLVNGIQLPAEPGIQIRVNRNYGTRETIEAIRAAARKVRNLYPQTQDIIVGDISTKTGGHLPPHKSHQSGRDADISYYHSGPTSKRFVDVSRSNLDVPRTWAFIEGLLASGQVEYLFIDWRVQKLLYAYARDFAKEPPERLARLFQHPRGRNTRVGVIRHARGHRNHMHVRFFSPEAVAAVRTYFEVTGQSPVRTVPRFHKVRRGDSLWKIAQKYKVSIKQLARWNHIRRNAVLPLGHRLRVGSRQIVQPPPAALKTPGT